LDVLAGAEGVGAKVGAGAGVVADLEAADADAVLAAGGRVAHLVVAEDAVAAEVLDAELALHRPPAAQVGLFFPEHVRPGLLVPTLLRGNALTRRSASPPRRAGGTSATGVAMASATRSVASAGSHAPRGNQEDRHFSGSGRTLTLRKATRPWSP